MATISQRFRRVHAKKAWIGLVVAAVFLTGGVALSVSALSRARTPDSRAAAAACDAYYHHGLAETKAISSAPITIHLTASFATTAGRVRQIGSADPESMQALDASTPINVCYLSSLTGTEALAIEPDGTAVVIRAFSPPVIGPPS